MNARKIKGFHKGVFFRGTLYFLLAFILAFTTFLPCFSGATEGYAQEIESGTPETGTEGGTEGEPGGEPPSKPIPKIIDVGIYYTGTGTALGFASNPDRLQGSIATRGGNIQFDSEIVWDDWSANRNHHLVTWSVDNNSIATITPSGILTAVSDGTVQIKATVSGAETDTGSSKVAYAYVQITGQSFGRYVTSVQIADESGNALGDISRWEPDLKTAMRQFHAIVQVYDPTNNSSETYSTINGSLSTQTSDISDIVWGVSDPAMASIDDKTGMFRPREYGGVFVSATSNAGVSGASIRTDLLVQSNNPDGMQGDGNFPQTSLTIKVYYELYKPSEYGDEAYVLEKTYSVADVEALGTVTQTYTAFGGNSGFYTLTGRGVLFATLLKDAGVNVNEAVSFNLRSHDGDKAVSAGFVFMDRYYYPNIDIGMYVGAVPVSPMLALESNQRDGGNPAPNYSNMLPATRFRLLFGAIPGANNSEFQRKWIHTIEVVYKGAPAVERPGGGGGDNGGSGNGNNGDNPGNGGDGQQGSGNDIATGVVIGTANDGSHDAPTVGGVEGAASSEIADPETPLSSGGDSSQAGTYSIYQIMNRNDNTNEKTLDFENPLKRLVLPIGAAVLLAGGTEMMFWYRRQTKINQMQLLAT